MRTIAEQLREEGRQEGVNIGIEKGIAKGLEKGVEKGITKGIAQEKRTVILNMLKVKLDIKVISQVTGASAEEIQALQGNDTIDSRH